MKPFAVLVAVTLAGLASSQDQFPEYFFPTDTGLLSKEAGAWPMDVQTRKAVARILELTGLAMPADGVIAVATDEETLRKSYKVRDNVESWFYFLPQGYRGGLSSEDRALQMELQRAWELIPKLLEAKSARVFPDIPENHRWYESRAQLAVHGLILPPPNASARGQRFSRLYFAVAAREACAQVPKAADAIVKAGGELQADPAYGLWGSLSRWRSDPDRTFAATLIGLNALIDEFHVELEILGSDPAQMRLDIDRAYRGGFKDVPATHWAASAIETLHRKGLLKGYP